MQTRNEVAFQSTENPEYLHTCPRNVKAQREERYCFSRLICLFYEAFVDLAERLPQHCLVMWPCSKKLLSGRLGYDREYPQFRPVSWLGGYNEQVYVSMLANLHIYYVTCYWANFHIDYVTCYWVPNWTTGWSVENSRMKICAALLRGTLLDSCHTFQPVISWYADHIPSRSNRIPQKDVRNQTKPQPTWLDWHQALNNYPRRRFHSPRAQCDTKRWLSL